LAGAHSITPNGLALHLRVTPNAASDRIEGLETRADGAEVLKVRVRAVPEAGKANKAVIALIAGLLDVPKSAVAVTAGETGRLKSLLISGDGAALAARLVAKTA
jgi:uncharacterized protein YggU (UPF0235/DUF167 family)